MKKILTIAGSDTCAGAGIQQDLKTATAMGCYAATVITAITSQNTIGVQDVMAVPAAVVRKQIRSVLSDLDVSAIKIGMIPNIEVAKAIVEEINKMESKDRKSINLVLDPVMVSTSGRRLMEDGCIGYIKEHLIPLCTLVTPNIPEAEILPPPYPTSFLIKGGHAESRMMTDTLYNINGTKTKFSSERIESTNLHGTGCTLSTAIACALAQGKTLEDAVAMGKEIINQGIKKGRYLCIGKGNGPLWLF